MNTVLMATAPNVCARRCAHALNSLHSLLYFTAEMATQVEEFGITEHSSIYLAGRAAPLGAVPGPVIVAAFNTFAPDLITARVPALWESITPSDAIAARLRAADALLRRLIPADLLTSAAVARAADVAVAAAHAGSMPGRALYAANVDLAVPAEPHLALWHSATLLREHRGDGHTAVLAELEVTGPDALVLDCASELGMDMAIVKTQRGWSDDEWADAGARLSDRGLIDIDGNLTRSGSALRTEIESRTSRIDSSPYAAIGEQATAALADVVFELVQAARGAYPPPLDEFFAPPRTRWEALV